MPDSVRDLDRHATAPLRADEIIDQCKIAFAQKGFDGASMQDLARAAGMSASNFYRYFDSKDAIIVALVDRKMAEIENEFAALDGSQELRPILLSTLANYLGRTKDESDAILWAEIQSAATRRPAVADALEAMEQKVTDSLIALFAEMSGLPAEDVARRYRAHAAMIFLLSRGALMTQCGIRRALDSETSSQLIALVMRAVDQLLNDILASR